MSGARAEAASRPRTHRRADPGALAAAAVALAAMLATWDRGLNLLDEGFVLHGAERVAAGQLPYRDFFTLVTPGAFLAHAAAFAAIPAPVLAGRALAVMLGTLIPLLVYALARRMAGARASLAAALLATAWGVSEAVWPVHANYSWFAAAATLACAWVASGARAGLAAASVPRLTAAAALAGLAIAFKQNTGLAALAALSVPMALAHRGAPRSLASRLAVVWGVAALVQMPWLLWIAAGGGLGELLRCLVSAPLGAYRTGGAAPYPPLGLPPLAALTAPALADALVAAARRLVAWVPLAVGAWAVLRAWRREPGPGGGPRELVTSFALFGLVPILPRADLVHVLFAIAPAWPLAAPMLEGAWRRRDRARPWGAPGATAAALALALLLAGPLVDGLAAGRNRVRLDRREAPVWLLAEDRDALVPVLDAIAARTRPGEPIFVVPWAAMLYVLARRPNPTGYDLVTAGNLPPSEEPRLLAQLEARPPRLVVRGRTWDVGGVPLEIHAPRVSAWISERYRPVEVLDGWVLLAPRETAEGAAPAIR